MHPRVLPVCCVLALGVAAAGGRETRHAAGDDVRRAAFALPSAGAASQRMGWGAVRQSMAACGRRPNGKPLGVLALRSMKEDSAFSWADRQVRAPGHTSAAAAHSRAAAVRCFGYRVVHVRLPRADLIGPPQKCLRKSAVPDAVCMHGRCCEKGCHRRRRTLLHSQVRWRTAGPTILAPICVHARVYTRACSHTLVCARMCTHTHTHIRSRNGSRRGNIAYAQTVANQQ